MALTLLWDRDEDEQMLSPAVEGRSRRTMGTMTVRVGSWKLKTAERDSLDQLEVRLLVVVSFDQFWKKKGIVPTLRRTIDVLWRRRCW